MPLAQQAATLLAAGLMVSGTTVPAGVYACDEATQGKIVRIEAYIAKNGTFPGGGATLASLTVTMPVPGFDSQIVALTFNADITALTISPNSGQTFLVAPPTSAVAGGVFVVRWKASVSQWWPA